MNTKSSADQSDPFPMSENDVARRGKTKEVTLWTEGKDQSISFPQ
jgi:hypothetical protein